MKKIIEIKRLLLRELDNAYSEDFHNLNSDINRLWFLFLQK